MDIENVEVYNINIDEQRGTEEEEGEEEDGRCCASSATSSADRISDRNAEVRRQLLFAANNAVALPSYCIRRMRSGSVIGAFAALRQALRACGSAKKITTTVPLPFR